MANKMRVTVLDREQDDGEDWPPRDAVECVAWFSVKLKAIPAEYLTTAKVEISSVDGYVRIEIFYDRPETVAEVAARELKEQLRKEAQKARELQTLAHLKNKYETC